MPLSRDTASAIRIERGPPIGMEHLRFEIVGMSPLRAGDGCDWQWAHREAVQTARNRRNQRKNGG